MKKILFIIFIIAFLTLSGCSSTQFVDSWRNSEISVFQPQKILVLGMTDNLTARKIFEEQLTMAFTKRNINAVQSSIELDDKFTNRHKTKSEIDEIKDKLIADGYDAVAITAVIGVDDKREYKSGIYYPMGFGWYRFGYYYYRYQGTYYDPGYYDDYKVYHVETSIYNFNQDEEKSLVWVGSFNIVDPKSITDSVNDYVEQIVKQLEKDGVIQLLEEVY